MLGIKTIGNATLIAYDDAPVLATDPWLGGEDVAYFGSWRLSHRIPTEERSDILRAPYVWFSHGHPDHLNGDSLAKLHHATILLPDHVGGRIKHDLEEQGFTVQILPDRAWVPLSKNIRVFCISNVIQDAVLLVEVNKRLFINLNDAGTRGCWRLLQRMAKGYDFACVLAFASYGDADMINYFRDDGTRILPAAAQRFPVGRWLSNLASSLHCHAAVPFSTFHAYQRRDSIWANEYTTPLAAYEEGFDHSRCRFIPPFSAIDAVTLEATPLNPPMVEGAVFEPEVFGDNWSDPLTTADKAAIDAYFHRRQRLGQILEFIRFRVGGQDHTVALGGPRGRGVTFEVPRTSLMTAIAYEVFDDLLIGNFMRTTLHNVTSLYDPNFNFFVTKYGDNGRAYSEEELNQYFQIYRQRVGREWLYAQFEETSKQLLRRALPHSLFYKTKNLYLAVQRLIQI